MKKNAFVSKKNKGFTLVEMIVVIGIIAVITTVVLMSLDSARSQNRDKVRVADIKSIQLALEMFYNKNKYYPDSLWTGVTSLISSVDLPAEIKDPTNDTSHKYVYVPINPRSGVTMCRSYHLMATFENNMTEYLVQKANFNSMDPAVVKCGGASGVDASTAPLIYDVKPTY